MSASETTKIRDFANAVLRVAEREDWDTVDVARQLANEALRLAADFDTLRAENARLQEQVDDALAANAQVWRHGAEALDILGAMRERADLFEGRLRQDKTLLANLCAALSPVLSYLEIGNGSPFDKRVRNVMTEMREAMREIRSTLGERDPAEVDDGRNG